MSSEEECREHVLGGSKFQESPRDEHKTARCRESQHLLAVQNSNVIAVWQQRTCREKCQALSDSVDIGVKRGLIVERIL